MVVSTLLGAILILSLAASLEWRYKLTYSVPSYITDNDLGFRFRLDVRRCRNVADIEGRSPSYFGQCGLLERASMKRVKIESHDAIASLNKSVMIEDSFVSWLSAQLSRWEDAQFHSGQLWDSDFNRAKFSSVIFENMDIRGLSFRDASFEKVTFRNTSLLDVSFRGAKLNHVIFENSECRNCDFRDAKMGTAKLDKPFVKAVYSLATELPFPYEQVGKYGFELYD